ncbi:hypothetical protein BpHYR1_006944 [Brachionus plicatilis]|uniref:Uncharacterized protein n=1 Tax=Brachionus plicatilis TaxID=10195 RepID=A0A3M7SGP4_BRAPC|nr:hypothetical protein BpHYR1_006944 [Brachionus plicatilis]
MTRKFDGILNLIRSIFRYVEKFFDEKMYGYKILLNIKNYQFGASDHLKDQKPIWVGLVLTPKATISFRN